MQNSNFAGYGESVSNFIQPRTDTTIRGTITPAVLEVVWQAIFWHGAILTEEQNSNLLITL